MLFRSWSADWAPTIVRVGVAAVVMAFVCAKPGNRTIHAPPSDSKFESSLQFGVAPGVSWRWLWLHVVCLVAVFVVGDQLFASSRPSRGLFVGWTCLGFVAGVAAGFFLVPPRVWRELLIAYWRVFVLAALAGVAAYLAASASAYL